MAPLPPLNIHLFHDNFASCPKLSSSESFTHHRVNLWFCSENNARGYVGYTEYQDPQLHRSSHATRSRASDSEVDHPASRSAGSEVGRQWRVHSQETRRSYHWRRSLLGRAGRGPTNFLGDVNFFFLRIAILTGLRDKKCLKTNVKDNNNTNLLLLLLLLATINCD